MKIADIRTKTADELSDELVKLKKEQFNLRFQKATGQLENTARVRQVRRDIARIQTVITAKIMRVCDVARDQGTAFVVVTHDLSLAAKLHRRVTLVSGIMAEVA